MNSVVQFPLQGVFCAAATPVLETGAPDHHAFAAHCHALLREGCHGIALLGTTGEANSFGVGQRRDILEKAIESGIEAARLMPGTSQTSVADTVNLTRHAVEAGVAAVVLLPPFYYKGVPDEGLFRFYAEVIEGVGSSALRVILYHIPPVAQVGIAPALVSRLREVFPGIVVGIKDSSGSLASMEAFARSFPSFAVLAGADPLMLPLLRTGGAGCITSSANLIAAHLRVVFDHWNDQSSGERVAVAQQRIEAWRALSNAYVQLPTIKAMLARRRDHWGWTRVRPPLVQLEQAQIDGVWAAMAELEAAENA
jgi:4-hydroxy-tetrahydrodipicolinate synthase